MASPALTNPIIHEAFKQFDKEQKEILIRNAAKAYAAGDIQAQNLVGAAISFTLVDTEALAYMEQYRDDLVRRGGSYVTVEVRPGKYEKQFKPWLNEATDKTREDVARIIDTGIREGKAVQGTGKNSIVGELREYFSVRQNHAEVVARTETMNVINDASMRRYQKSGIRFVKRLEGGPNMCDKCAAIMGNVYPIDQAPPATLHPQCVGTNIPHPGPATAVM